MDHGKRSAHSVLTAGPVIPVLVVSHPQQAVSVAQALVAGGIRVLEVTLRTREALAALSLIIRHVPEAIVGAGTVLNARQLQQVADAGAQFAFSPGTTEPLLRAALAGPIPLIPGISTASELMTGLDYGVSEFKFFPAYASGGISTLHAFSGPFPQARFCPTGGISALNYRDYLALDNVLCTGGSWLVPAQALVDGDYSRITRLAQQAVAGGIPGNREGVSPCGGEGPP